ncbi:hypothetical protein ABK040_007956 [Willaertia magna]
MQQHLCEIICCHLTKEFQEEIIKNNLEYKWINKYIKLEEDKIKLNKYFHKIDTYRSLIGQVMCQSTFNHLFLNNLTFKKSNYNKPYLENNLNNNLNNNNLTIDYNITHSGEYILFGYCFNNIIGIDVEKIEIKPIMENKDEILEFFQLMKSCFTIYEWITILLPAIHYCNHLLNIDINNIEMTDIELDNLILELINNTKNSNEIRKEIKNRFFIHWTLKESFIKSIGMGISFGELTRIEFHFKNRLILPFIDLNNTIVIKNDCKDIKIFIDGKDESKDFNFYLIKDLNEDYMISICIGELNCKFIEKSLKMGILNNVNSYYCNELINEMKINCNWNGNDLK